MASTAQGEPREGAIIDYLRNGKSGLALITGKDGKRNWHATDLRYIVARSGHPPIVLFRLPQLCCWMTIVLVVRLMLPSRVTPSDGILNANAVEEHIP